MPSTRARETAAEAAVERSDEESDSELEREMAALETIERERRSARSGGTTTKAYVNNAEGLKASLEGA